MSIVAEMTDLSLEEITALPIEAQRELYAFYQRAALYGMSRKQLDEALARHEPVTPIDWIKAIMWVRVECSNCRGTGTYSWGACINGKMSHSGTCYRCNGKGHQLMEDFRRNRGYDKHQINNAWR